MTQYVILINKLRVGRENSSFMKNEKNETRQKLAEVLRRKMAEKPLSKITIKELTDACHIRRQSFYYYFEDIYDLIRWKLRREAEEAISRHGDMVTWQEAIMDIFSYIQENKAQCLCLLNSDNREYLQKVLYDDLRNIFEKAAFPYTGILQDSAADRKFMEFEFHYLAISLVALYENWARGAIKESPEFILKALETMLLDQVNGSMQRDRKVGETLKTLEDHGIKIKLP